MATLNSRLQLALLNRKKGRNLLEQGFTLVELMIVIVIVGVLSSVALPNFLNQTAKAKGSECSTKMASLLKQVHADIQLDGNAVEAVKAIQSAATVKDMIVTAPATPDTIARESNSGLFFYKIGYPTDSKTREIQISCQAWESATGSKVPVIAGYPDAIPDDTLEAKGMFGCINLETGKIHLSRRLLDAETVYDVKDSTGNSKCLVTGAPVAPVTKLL